MSEKKRKHMDDDHAESMNQIPKKKKRKEINRLPNSAVIKPKKKKRKEINRLPNSAVIKPELVILSSSDNSPVKEKYRKRKTKEDVAAKKCVSFNLISNEKKHSSNEDRQTDWNKDEVIKFLTAMKCQVKEESKKSHGKELNHFQWDKMNTNLENNKTAEQCSKKFKELQANVIKHRNLSEIVSACERLSPIIINGKGKVKKKVVRPIDLFSSRHKEEIMRLVKSKKIHYFTACNKLYSNCPKEEKAIIMEEISKLKGGNGDLKRRNERLSTPFMMFYNKKKATFTSLDGCKAIVGIRKKWDELGAKTKLRYITRYVDKLQEALVSNSDIAEKKPLISMSHANAELYLTHLNMPSIPARNGRDLFLRFECRKYQDAMIHLSKLWEKSSKTQKEEWKTKAKEAINKFDEDYRAWEAEQTEMTKLLVHHFFGNKIDRFLCASKAKIAVENCKMNTVEVSMSLVRFIDAPTFLRMKLSPFGQYVEDQKLKGKKVTAKEYRKLRMSEKKNYMIMAAKAKQKLINELIDYVRALSELCRGCYLGFYRAIHIRHFQEDIFESIFPVSKYAVYTHKKDKIAALKVMEEQVKAAAGNSSEDDFESPISEQKKSFKVNKRKKKNLPHLKMASQLFSSSESE